MNGGLRAWVLAVRSSYWFYPGAMAAVALLLGVGMIWIDETFGHDPIARLSWYQQIRTDGARAVLSTIAGSMITVAGVVFSITIVALSYASSQYGPRVLTNFMSDRGNTITLGTFIATFLYCLMVLRTIRGGDEDFVPQYAVIVAMLLAVCSIGVLIYFIHHVPQSIHINNVVAQIGERLIADARTRFPTLIGSSADEEVPVGPPEIDGEVVRVRCSATGYIQALSEGRLLELANKTDAIIRLRYRPGDFVTTGSPLADVAASDWDDAASEALQRCFTVGRKRTPESDLMFLVSELVEIAARALSPGVNDPMTAITCIDWLGAAGAEFARRRLPQAVRVDDEGNPRIIAKPDDFACFVESGFGRLNQYAARDVVTSLHLLRVLGELSAACRLQAQVDILSTQAARFAEFADDLLQGVGARAVRLRAAQLRTLLTKGVDGIEAEEADWLNGCQQ